MPPINPIYHIHIFLIFFFFTNSEKPLLPPSGQSQPFLVKPLLQTQTQLQHSQSDVENLPNNVFSQSIQQQPQFLLSQQPQSLLSQSTQRNPALISLSGRNNVSVNSNLQSRNSTPIPQRFQHYQQSSQSTPIHRSNPQIAESAPHNHTEAASQLFDQILFNTLQNTDSQSQTQTQVANLLIGNGTPMSQERISSQQQHPNQNQNHSSQQQQGPQLYSQKQFFSNLSTQNTQNTQTQTNKPSSQIQKPHISQPKQSQPILSEILDDPNSLFSPVQQPKINNSAPTAALKKLQGRAPVEVLTSPKGKKPKVYTNPAQDLITISDSSDGDSINEQLTPQRSKGGKRSDKASNEDGLILPQKSKLTKSASKSTFTIEKVSRPPSQASKQSLPYNSTPSLSQSSEVALSSSKSKGSRTPITTVSNESSEDERPFDINKSQWGVTPMMGTPTPFQQQSENNDANSKFGKLGKRTQRFHNDDYLSEDDSDDDYHSQHNRLHDSNDPNDPNDPNDFEDDELSLRTAQNTRLNTLDSSAPSKVRSIGSQPSLSKSGKKSDSKTSSGTRSKKISNPPHISPTHTIQGKDELDHFPTKTKPAVPSKPPSRKAKSSNNDINEDVSLFSSKRQTRRSKPVFNSDDEKDDEFDSRLFVRPRNERNSRAKGNGRIIVETSAPCLTTNDLMKIQGGKLLTDDEIELLVANFQDYELQGIAETMGRDVLQLSQSIDCGDANLEELRVEASKRNLSNYISTKKRPIESVTILKKQENHIDGEKNTVGRYNDDTIIIHKNETGSNADNRSITFKEAQHEAAKNDERLAYKLAFGHSPIQSNLTAMYLPYQEGDWQMKYFNDIDAQTYFAEQGFHLYSESESSCSDSDYKTTRRKGARKGKNLIGNYRKGSRRYRVPNDKRAVVKARHYEEQIAAKFTSNLAKALDDDDLERTARQIYKVAAQQHENERESLRLVDPHFFDSPTTDTESGVESDHDGDGDSVSCGTKTKKAGKSSGPNAPKQPRGPAPVVPKLAAVTRGNNNLLGANKNKPTAAQPSQVNALLTGKNPPSLLPGSSADALDGDLLLSLKGDSKQKAQRKVKQQELDENGNPIQHKPREKKNKSQLELDENGNPIEPKPRAKKTSDKNNGNQLVSLSRNLMNNNDNKSDQNDNNNNNNDSEMNNRNSNELLTFSSQPHSIMSNFDQIEDVYFSSTIPSQKRQLPSQSGDYLINEYEKLLSQRQPPISSQIFLMSQTQHEEYIDDLAEDAYYDEATGRYLDAEGNEIVIDVVYEEEEA
jgi:hypothetical protein